jgi:TPR repeat protein
MPIKSRKERAEALFVLADKEEESGNLRSAFRHLLAAAKLGDLGAQLNVGNCYDDATGVRRNRAAGMYWYKRAYRRGCGSAANNIGVVFRKEKKFGRALAWFECAVKLGDEETNLEIGKYYLLTANAPAKSIPYFRRVIRGKYVSEFAVEEAEKLLRQAMNARKKALRGKK